MAFRFYTIPARGDRQQEADLNGFLRSHRVLSVDRRWVEQGEHSHWCFCIDYLDAPGGPGAGAGPGSAERVDYRAVLSPAQFEVFARLRLVRKELAEKEGVPVFSVFTNEQLAEMVRRQCRTREALRGIDGIGEARVSRYGAAVLAVLSAPPESAPAVSPAP
ncbi:MAG: HRDC domain-containing protein [Verrucomicrobia bacterium]|nr:HRDC domain-containing protein [Verrucomicrobiota bacterium]